MINIPLELLNEYMRRFINRLDIWGKQYIDREGKCQYAQQNPTTKYFYPYESVTTSLLERMFDGQVTCSWAAIDADSCSRFLCWDSDNENGDIAKVQRVLDAWKFATIREGIRPGRDGHLWLLLEEPLPAKSLMRFAKEVMAHAAVERKYGSLLVECFPKSVSGYSQVRAPLSIHRKAGANNSRGWFDGPEREIMPQLEWLAAQPLNEISGINRIVSLLDAHDKRVTDKTLFPKSLNKVSISGSHLDLLLHIPEQERKQRRNHWQTACPVCVAAGMDTHSDNLHISIHDGTKFCCRAGHGPKEIVAAFYV